jgi:hypothetical protein
MLGKLRSGLVMRISVVLFIHLETSAGEQLETVHLERQRAQAAYDLIEYYNQFSRDDTSRLDALKKEGKEGRRQVAVILRRLITVAKEVDLPTADKVRSASRPSLAVPDEILRQTRESIDKYCEKFEKDMLYLFDRCYRKGDPKMMHVCRIVNMVGLELSNLLYCPLVDSTARRHSLSSTAVHPASKSTSTNMTFLLTAFVRTRPTTPCCSFPLAWPWSPD